MMTETTPSTTTNTNHKHNNNNNNSKTTGSSGNGKKREALFLGGAEQFLFDFGASPNVRENSPTAITTTTNTIDTTTNTINTTINTNDSAHAETEPISTVQGKQVVIPPLAAEEVRRCFHTAIPAGERVFVNLSLDEALTQFQSGLRKYGEALYRQMKQQKKQRTLAKKQHGERVRLQAHNSNSNNNNNNNSGVGKKRKRV
ncbi:uncharacterized protein TM35_000131530 [Trypanosoma theileri]|uniref:Uncharacterized protein n=1 Tax=Trypanosoma theileri TaxID=67003 RepID=A0A1X0NY47_9TRYP|nr:uncharacterized protein TM35_000131530 [Trypanosoma theileri]ORC89149.1 hypothetical protein TM35_000131530 [Trypanosoma theileri]